MAPKRSLDPEQALADALRLVRDELPPEDERTVVQPLRPDDATQLRNTEILTMALAGFSSASIGARFAIGASRVEQIIAETLEHATNANADRMRKMENARLDRAQAAIWSQVLSGDKDAVNTFLRISARRAKMNGLDAPTQLAISASIRVEMEAALAELEAVIIEGTVVDPTLALPPPS